MNKNPFLPTPSFTPQQPPLPPGPPPPQPTQPDYSTWWANAAAAQQTHMQPPTVGPYNAQWATPQPPRPPAEQSALYANYGYGTQNNWRQQQQLQQQQQQYHPAPPVVPQPPPPSQPGYNPYHPTAGYPQQYVSQPPPQPMANGPYPHPPTQPQQQFFVPPMQPQQPQHHHQQQQSQPRHMHQPSPQSLPPAKRQRFDGPNNSRHHANQPHHPPPQPQFQPPPAPPQNVGSFSGPNHTIGRGGPPTGPGGRGGAPTGPAGRPGLVGGGRGGRGGSMGGNRVGVSSGRGRGGGSFVGGNLGRGGAIGGPVNGPMRNHGSRSNFGGGNKDFHNRRGGSFGSGNYSHQGSSSFRGRNQGHTGSNRGRGDGGSGPSFGSRDGTTSSSFGKKDENRRTLTDFKLVGLAIPELSWSWGMISSPSILMAEKDGSLVDGTGNLDVVIKEEDNNSLQLPSSPGKEDSAASEPKTDTSHIPKTAEIEMTDVKATQDPPSAPRGDTNLPPPSRIRIYFHTPVTADDCRPIPHSSAYGDSPSDLRKGKRKKLEDDDGELDDRRVRPPPQMGNVVNDDRSSVGASVAETASEADWLMAAIVEGEEEAEAAGVLHPDDEDEDVDQLHVSQIVNDSIHDGSAGGDAGGVDGNSSHEVHMEAVAEHPPLASSAGGDEGGSPPSPVDFVVDAPEVVRDSYAPDSNASTVDPEQTDIAPDHQLTETGVSFVDSSVPTTIPSLSEDGAAISDSAADHSADHSQYLETQIYSTQTSSVKSLEALSAEPTLLDIDTDGEILAQAEDLDYTTGRNETQAAELIQDDDLMLNASQPEPPASPTSNTLPSTSSAGTSEDPSIPIAGKPDQKGTKTPSANRLSISYSRGNRRLVVDAEVVESLKLFRQEGKIEAVINIDKDKDDCWKGIFIEGLSEVTKSYLPLLSKEDVAATDQTIPPFPSLPVPSTIRLVIYLDTARPLSEPKWAKTGDVQEWLKSMFGRMFWVAGDAAAGWEKKIQVVDPDPPPTIWTVLDGWATNSPVGVVNERQRFLKTHMTETDNILEILLRLVRGERATPFSQSTPTISAPSISGPLLSALSPGSAHGAQQTHVSLAVLATFRMTVEYAKKALGDKGKSDAEERIGEIIRCLPSHLLYKSLDGIFKEWRVEKKGR